MIVRHASNKRVRVKVKRTGKCSLHLSLQVKKFIVWIAYDTMKTTFAIKFAPAYNDPEKQGNRIMFEPMIPVTLNYQFGSFVEVWPINKFVLKDRCNELFDYWASKQESESIVSDYIKETVK